MSGRRTTRRLVELGKRVPEDVRPLSAELAEKLNESLTPHTGYRYSVGDAILVALRVLEREVDDPDFPEHWLELQLKRVREQKET